MTSNRAGTVSNLRLDPRAQHVGERDAKCAAKHQVGNDPQHRQKDSETEKKDRQRKPLDAAQVVRRFPIAAWDRSTGKNLRRKRRDK